MSTFREQLILQALAALSEIADECGESPAGKTLSLRFLLAYTFIASGADSKSKWLWVQFWRDATAPLKQAAHERKMDAYIRSTGARTALNGICREVGYPPDVDFLQMLRFRHRDNGRRKVEPPPSVVPANDVPTDDDAA